jgi:class 3 adenylate cyclase
MAELPTGTVTFLFTDLEGSTRLWEEHPEAMKSALARHDEILQDAVTGHRGQVVKTTGDGIHAVFVTAEDAIAAAIAAQRALAERADNPTGPLRVRMGIHTGAAEQRDGDYYGSAVNRAARLMSAAHGGQILVSHATEELARDNLPEETALLDLGEHTLRDLARPERIFQVVTGGVGTNFPALQTLDAFRATCRRRSPRSSDASVSLPPSSTRSAGRGWSRSPALAVSGRPGWRSRPPPKWFRNTATARGSASSPPRRTATP